MSVEIEPKVAERPCSACGMCCDGTLFQEVHLQPEDSVSAVSALGLRLKSRRGSRYFEQPCRAFCGTHCSIYDERPVRCRSFECRQLVLVADGAIDETGALQTIQQARELVRQVEQLVDRCGATNKKRSLKQRFEKANSEPVNIDGLSGAIEDRARLMRSFQQLRELLDTEFRVYEEDESEQSTE